MIPAGNAGGEGYPARPPQTRPPGARERAPEEPPRGTRVNGLIQAPWGSKPPATAMWAGGFPRLHLRLHPVFFALLLPGVAGYSQLLLLCRQQLCRGRAAGAGGRPGAAGGRQPKRLMLGEFGQGLYSHRGNRPVQKPRLRCHGRRSGDRGPARLAKGTRMRRGSGVPLQLTAAGRRTRAAPAGRGK